MSPEPCGQTLLFALFIPEVESDEDPEMYADILTAIINEERDRNGGNLGHVEVSLIPAAQWLGAETMANLRRAAGRG